MANKDAEKLNQPEDGLAAEPEKLSDPHKAEDQPKSDRAEDAEREWVEDKEEELSDENRTFGKMPEES